MFRVHRLGETIMGVSALSGTAGAAYAARAERPSLSLADGKAITIDPKAAADAVIVDPEVQAMADRMRPEVMAAHEEWMGRQRAYMDSLNALVRETFGIPEDAGYMIGGAAHAAIDALAARHGLVKPEMPAVMKEAGWTDPADQMAREATSDTGVFAILHTAVNSPDFGKSLTIAFDRNAGLPESAMRVVDLKSKDAGALIGRVLEGPLGGSVRTDMRSNSGVFAITDGAPADKARIAATVRSVGMNDVATGGATDVLATMMRLLKGG